MASKIMWVLSPMITAEDRACHVIILDQSCAGAAAAGLAFPHAMQASASPAGSGPFPAGNGGPSPSTPSPA